MVEGWQKSSNPHVFGQRHAESGATNDHFFSVLGRCFGSRHFNRSEPYLERET